MTYYFKGLDYNIGIGDSSQYSFTKDVSEEVPEDAMTNSVRAVLAGYFDSIAATVTCNEEKTEFTYTVNVVEGGHTYVYENVNNVVSEDLFNYQDIS
jgi:surfactin synthase thioesterase subunit